MPSREEMIAALRGGVKTDFTNSSPNPRPNESPSPTPTREEMLAALRSNNDSGVGDAALRGVQQYSTLGYYPEIQGALLNSANSDVDADLKARGFNIVEPNYRDIERQKMTQAQEQHPLAFNGAGLASAAALSGGAGLLAKALGVAGSAAGGGIMSGMVRGTAGGALMGAAQNPNVNPGQEGINAGERIKNAMFGGLVGGGAGAIGGAISKLNPQGLEERAGEQAFRATNPGQRAAEKLQKNVPDILSETGIEGKIKQSDRLGKTLLREGVINDGTSSYEGLADKTKEAVVRRGEEIDSIITKLSDAAKKKLTPGHISAIQASGAPVGVSEAGEAGISKRMILDKLNAALEQQKGVPGQEGDVRRMQSVINSFDQMTPDIVPIKDAQKIKTSIGKVINWERQRGADVPVKEQAQRLIYHGMQQGLEDAGDALGDVAGASIKKDYMAAKQAFSDLKNAQQILDKSAGRESANRYFSLSDYQSSQLGGILGAIAGHGNPVVSVGSALASAGANKAARTFGPQMTAKMNFGLLNAMNKPTLAGNALRGAGAVGSAVGSKPGLLGAAAAQGFIQKGKSNGQ